MDRCREEIRYTLRLDRGRGTCATLALLRRSAFFGGSYNVWESQSAGAESHRAGHLLSWRWLGHGEAMRLLSRRVALLESLGYLMLAARRRRDCDWLAELLRRGVAGKEEVIHASARDAMLELGVGQSELVAALASVLGIPEAAVLEPKEALLATIDRRTLALLLAPLLEHEDAAVVALAARWLAVPVVPYELPPAVLEAFLARGSAHAEAFAHRLPREGLALVGPGPLFHLRRESASRVVRRCAAAWSGRLGGLE